MPQAKRERRERTDNYHLLQQWCRTPEQRLYDRKPANSVPQNNYTVFSMLPGISGD